MRLQITDLFFEVVELSGPFRRKKKYEITLHNKKIFFLVFTKMKKI